MKHQHFSYVWSRVGPFLSLCFFHAAQLFRAQGESHYDYRYMLYDEEDDRVRVETHTALFEQQLIESISAHGEFVYDSISGATPNGVVPTLAPNSWLTTLEDTRRAGNLGLDIKLGQHTVTPGVAVSEESDYSSRSISLSDAFEFNEKNTTLRLGVSRNFDKVLGVDPMDPNSPRPRFWNDKDSTEALIGVSQLLSSKTVFTADFTFGYESGYLNDPYRGVYFYDYPDPSTVYPEIRPDSRSKEVLLLTLTQYFDPLSASLEASYRFYHDSYEVFANTAGLTWHQRLGKHVLIEPMVRAYEQSEASFYTPLGVPGFFPGDGIARPANYSADYRLSEFWSLTYGLQASLIIKDSIYIDVGYHRYEMRGLDDVTASVVYPNADIFTVGLRVWF